MTRQGRVIVYGRVQKKYARCFVLEVVRARKASLREVEQVPCADREIIEVLPLNRERKQGENIHAAGKLSFKGVPLTSQPCVVSYAAKETKSCVNSPD